MGAHEFKVVQDAVITALGALRESHGVQTIAPYQELSELQNILEGTIRFPALYVLCNGLDIQWRNEVDEKSLELFVVIAQQHSGGVGEAASDAYSILRAVRDTLHENKTVLAGTPDFWLPLRCVREESAYEDLKRGFSVMTAMYLTRTTFYREDL